MNIFGATLYCILAVYLGWLLLKQILGNSCPRSAARIDALILVLMLLSGGLGIGVSSCIWFLCMLFCHSTKCCPLIVQAILLAGLLATSFIKNRSQLAQAEQAESGQVDARAKVDVWLEHSSILALLTSIVFFVVLNILRPYGNWDALMIWNLHAKYLASGAGHWQDLFSNSLFWSHPDYPLLIPGFIACCWRLLGFTAALVPQLLALFFFSASAMMVFLILQIMRDRTQALWAAGLLLSTPAMVEQGANQCADVPLGFYMLSAFVCVLLSEKFPRAKARLSLIAGLMTGLAAWTKNEGLLFACVFMFVHIIQSLRRAKANETWLQRLAPFMGLLPVLAIVFYFKHLAPANDIIAGQSLSSTVASFLDWHRYLVLAQYFALQAGLFGHWIVTPLPIILVYLLCTPKQELLNNGACGTISLSLLLMLCGYFFIYLSLPVDIAGMTQRLIFSLDRLFVGLWPSALLLIFYAIRPTKEPIKQN